MLRQHADEGHGGRFVIIDDTCGYGLVAITQIDALTIFRVVVVKTSYFFG